MTMKTVVLQKPGRLALTTTAAPESFSAEEALVRVSRIGICGTDLHAFK
jgi:threonine dehydrogenase-like Zn-dependent dehydrogenase